MDAICTVVMFLGFFFFMAVLDRGWPWDKKK